MFIYNQYYSDCKFSYCMFSVCESERKGKLSENKISETIFIL